jgi:hypothetical protein
MEGLGGIAGKPLVNGLNGFNGLDDGDAGGLVDEMGVDVSGGNDDIWR